VLFRSSIAIALTLVLVLTSSGLVLAQTSEPEADGETKQAIPEIKFLPPAYEDQMMRLSEILGALHYLRELCRAKEGQIWRDQMTKLIVAEGPSEARKARMIANFNKGFRGFREIYRECTPTAVVAANRYVKQGVKISAEIPDRYGR